MDHKCLMQYIAFRWKTENMVTRRVTVITSDGFKVHRTFNQIICSAQH